MYIARKLRNRQLPVTCFEEILKLWTQATGFKPVGLFKVLQLTADLSSITVSNHFIILHHSKKFCSLFILHNILPAQMGRVARCKEKTVFLYHQLLWLLLILISCNIFSRQNFKNTGTFSFLVSSYPTNQRNAIWNRENGRQAEMDVSNDPFTIFLL